MSAHPPVVFIGAGPGDPGLMTVRGERLLGEAQVVVFDAGVSPALLEGAAASAERIRVGEDATGVLPGEVGRLLVARALAGLRVARMVLGDAGGFALEASLVAEAGLELEVVPGVSGPIAGALYAGIPVSAGGRELLLLPIAGSTLSAVAAALVAGGWPGDTPAAAISGEGSFRQRTVAARLDGVADAAARAGLSSPTLLVVGDAVEARTPLVWRERRPLFGRRVLVTRPRAQAARFGALLESYGAEVVAVPTIRLEPPDDWRPLDDAIGRLSAFPWVIFTSANGVAAFRERLFLGGWDARALAGARLAAIGPETAEALRRIGLSPDVVPPEYRAEGLLEALASRVERGSEVLLIRAAEARDVLPRELESRGARVTIAPAYRTVTAKEGADCVVGLLESRGIDVVTFTSSSTVRGFMALLASDQVRPLLAGVVLAAIGPITAVTIAEYGLEAAVVPREYTVAALAAAIAARFARHQ